VKKKLSIILSVFFVLSAVLISSVAVQARSRGRERVRLGTGKKRAKIKLDYRSVNFPHKKHQELVVNKLKKTCKFCHHKKKEGRDPRACRRCHAGRQVRSKGGVGREPYIAKKVRKGKLLKMKDVFHVVCKGCHEKMRNEDIDLDSLGDDGAPLNCEGCHNPKEEDDDDDE